MNECETDDIYSVYRRADDDMYRYKSPVQQ